MSAVTAPARPLARRRTWVPARWRNRIGMVGLAIIVFNILVALFGPYVWTIDPNDPAYDRLLPPEWAHPMGTDDLGRDTLARIIHGASVALQIASIATAIALSVGLLIGVVAAFYRGPLDLVLMRVVDVAFAFPLLVLALLIVGLLGPSRTNATIAIGIVYIPAFARVIRGSVLEVMGFPYIESARSLGGRDLRIMRRHVLPNIVAPLTVLTTVYFAQAILAEASLSFLGVGVQPPEADWGNMLAGARAYIDRTIWLAIWPGLAIMLLVLGCNFLGDGLRDVLDPRISGTTADVVLAKTEH